MNLVKHWKRNLIISAFLLSPYFILILLSLTASGAASDTLAWIAILIPGLFYPFPILLLPGIAMLILGIIGAAIVGSKKFTFIRFGTSILVVLTLILLLMLSRILLLKQ